MTDLPNGWAETTLGDLLLRIEAGKSFRCEARPARPNEWGVIKASAMTWGEFREAENKAVRPDTTVDLANEVKPGDILLSRANTESYVGASVLVGDCRPRLLLSDKSLRLVPSPLVDRRWLACLLSSPGIRNAISRRATGTKDSMRNISQGSLREIGVLVPPLAEQHRIVAALEDHLSRLDAATAECSAAGARLPLLRRSALQALRQRALQLQAEILPLGMISTTSLGKMLDAKRNEGAPTPYLRNVNVRWGSLDLATIETVPMPEEQRVKYSLRVGDLLVCEGGEPGRCAIWPGGYDMMTYQKALHRIRPGEQITSEWLALMIEESVRNGRTSNLFTGTTIKHLPQEKLRTLRIPVPPLKIQEILLADFIESTQTVERFSAAIAASERRSRHLRLSLLTEAFAGRLIEQDPADEPASVLLERIRAEQPARRGKGEMAPQRETL